jgi:hypothetical protein
MLTNLKKRPGEMVSTEDWNRLIEELDQLKTYLDKDFTPSTKQVSSNPGGLDFPPPKPTLSDQIANGYWCQTVPILCGKG